MSKVTVHQAKIIKGSTNWNKVESLSDQDIKQATLTDIDTKPLSDHELKAFRRFKSIRHKMGL